ncbi:hypothetical protein HZB60_00325 [candidate division KSB1 bacterium]|nr:hypothetical protein [candidate division KSB1 bacterium]
MKATRLRTIVTAAALVSALAHLCYPSVVVDVATLTLIAIAVIPWLTPLFKSVELPGGLKVEFPELKSVEERAERAGLLAAKTNDHAAIRYPFQIVGDTDSNLALAGLRIEIEKRLMQIADAGGVGTQRGSITRLLKELSTRELIDNDDRDVLADLISLLNSAVHGASVDRAAADWALEVGPRILQALDNRIDETAARAPDTTLPIRILGILAVKELSTQSIMDELGLDFRNDVESRNAVQSAIGELFDAGRIEQGSLSGWYRARKQT